MSWRGTSKSLLLLAALGGCQEPAPSSPVTTPEATSPHPAVANSTPSVTEVAASTPSPAAEEKPPKEAVPTEPTPPPFEPPFGHRVELFVPPQQDAPAERTPRNEESFPEVVLKGFVSVGSPRAVLVIDGAVVTIGEGQEKHGIRLVAIEPPQVTLERGRRRWTLTLVKLVPANQSAAREPDPVPIEAALNAEPTEQPEPEPAADE